MQKVGGGQHHSMAIVSGGGPGRVFTWGRADYGHLGLGDTVSTAPGAFVNKPVEV